MILYLPRTIPTTIVGSYAIFEGDTAGCLTLGTIHLNVHGPPLYHCINTGESPHREKMSLSWFFRRTRSSLPSCHSHSGTRRHRRIHQYWIVSSAVRKKKKSTIPLFCGLSPTQKNLPIKNVSRSLAHTTRWIPYQVHFTYPRCTYTAFTGKFHIVPMRTWIFFSVHSIVYFISTSRHTGYATWLQHMSARWTHYVVVSSGRFVFAPWTMLWVLYSTFSE